MASSNPSTMILLPKEDWSLFLGQGKKEHQKPDSARKLWDRRAKKVITSITEGNDTLAQQAVILRRALLHTSLQPVMKLIINDLIAQFSSETSLPLEMVKNMKRFYQRKGQQDKLLGLKRVIDAALCSTPQQSSENTTSASCSTTKEPPAKQESGFHAPQTIGPEPRMNFGDGMVEIDSLRESLAPCTTRGSSTFVHMYRKSNATVHL